MEVIWRLDGGKMMEGRDYDEGRRKGGQKKWKKGGKEGQWVVVVVGGEG